MKKSVCMAMAALAFSAAGAGCAGAQGTGGGAAAAGVPKVYMFEEINSENLVKIYEVLGREASGKVAVKLSTGEPGGHNYLQPALIEDLVRRVNGTIVECNTAYGGGRADTEAHRRAAEEHGFTAIAPVDIMDADGEMALPVEGGRHLKEDFVGSHFADYDFVIILSHFKGHAMGGFGGAVKNMSIGIASSAGKAWIHSAGRTRDVAEVWNNLPEQDDFLESMAEAAKAVADHCGERILYISVANNLSVDCDCSAAPADPQMGDIGILASLDPIALDKACMCYSVSEALRFKEERISEYKRWHEEWVQSLISRSSQAGNAFVNALSIKKSFASHIKQALAQNNITCLYHFTDRANLESIIKNGGLYSWKYLEEHDISIPKQGGNLDSKANDQKFGLEDYVRLSFCDDHPMMWRLKCAGYNLVLLKIKVDVAWAKDTLFSDINATAHNHRHGDDIETFNSIDFNAVKQHYLNKSSAMFGPHQAEVMVKTCIPLEYILNIDNPIIR